MADKNLKVPFSSEDYDAIITNVATSKGWREQVRDAEAEKGFVDNPQTAEQYLIEQQKKEYLQLHVRREVQKAGQTAQAAAAEETEKSLKEKFGI